MRTFDYLKPASIRETLHLLAEHGPRARVIAGGTDLMVLWKKKLVAPDYMISVRNVPELNFLDFNSGLAIGSATTHRTLETSSMIRSRFPVLWDAVSNLGSVQVRNSATIGGNLCNAAPSADSAPPMLVLEAQVHLESLAGQRSVPIDQFFKGPGRTVLQPGELVTRFTVEEAPPNTGMAYWKHTRRKAMDLPILGVALSVTFEDDFKTCRKARIGLGVAAPTPMRARRAEEFLQGREITETTLEEAGSIASKEASPRTTIRGSEWYRREMVQVLVKRTGLICAERAHASSRA